MRIIAKRTLRLFWETHPRGADAKTPLQVWHSTVERQDWATPSDVKASYGDASILKNSRVVFNIGGQYCPVRSRRVATGYEKGQILRSGRRRKVQELARFFRAASRSGSVAKCRDHGRCRASFVRSRRARRR